MKKLGRENPYWHPNEVTLHAGKMPKQGDSFIGPGAVRGHHGYNPIMPAHGKKLTGVPPSVKKIKASVK